MIKNNYEKYIDRYMDTLVFSNELVEVENNIKLCKEREKIWEIERSYGRRGRKLGGLLPCACLE